MHMRKIYSVNIITSFLNVPWYGFKHRVHDILWLDFSFMYGNSLAPRSRLLALTLYCYT